MHFSYPAHGKGLLFSHLELELRIARVEGNTVRRLRGYGQGGFCFWYAARCKAATPETFLTLEREICRQPSARNGSD